MHRRQHPAADLALLYKSLLDVQRCFRDLKQVIELRPIHHRKADRIRAHVTLCFLALMLIRVAENTTAQTWPRPSRQMRMHLGQFTGPAGHVTQRTETTPAQREVPRALQLKEPPIVLGMQPTTRPRRPRKRA